MAGSRRASGPRPVVLGDWTGEDQNRWIVESGLKPGDNVIVNGVARIMMPGTPIKLAGAAPAGAPQPGAAPGPAAQGGAAPGGNAPAAAPKAAAAASAQAKQ